MKGISKEQDNEKFHFFSKYKNVSFTFKYLLSIGNVRLLWKRARARVFAFLSDKSVFNDNNNNFAFVSFRFLKYFSDSKIKP